MDDDKAIGTLPMTLAGASSDKGILWRSGEVRKKDGIYDQLISLGRLVLRGAPVMWDKDKFQLWLPGRAEPRLAHVEDFCPWITEEVTEEL